MYRETKKPEYLARAVKSADFLVSHRNLPADRIPYWDYEAAEIPYAQRDASAGAGFFFASATPAKAKALSVAASAAVKIILFIQAPPDRTF